MKQRRDEMRRSVQRTVQKKAAAASAPVAPARHVKRKLISWDVDFAGAKCGKKEGRSADERPRKVQKCAPLGPAGVVNILVKAVTCS